MFFRALFFLSLLFFLNHATLLAQQADTLSGVTLLSIRPAENIHNTNLSLTFNKKAIAGLNSATVAEVARFFPGIQVKDYGGVGGLKTVSLRSLGANYTTVLYNGMVLSDAQGGQTDLGRYSLFNTNAIEYTLNAPSSGLAQARAYINAALINIVPQFFIPFGEINLTSGVSAGSFGLINPFASINAGVSKNTSIHISGDWENANGKYRYKDYENGGAKKERINAGISAYRIETALHLRFTDSSYLLWQNYAYHANRGLPGAVILYTTPIGDKLVNTTLFSQLQWKTNISKFVSAIVSAKYASERKDYTDPDYPNSAGMLENFFEQQSVYGSLAAEWKPVKSFSLHYAADYVWDQLKRTDRFAVHYANPKRNGLYQNIGIAYRVSAIHFGANLLHNLIYEKVSFGNAAHHVSQFSPSVSANARLGKLPVYVRASFKYLYRNPTFDELYFTNIGNTALRPEMARLYNLGCLGSNNFSGKTVQATWSVDGYYQYVTDKIMAIPRQNLFQWSMMNVGKAAITGADATFNITMLCKKAIYTAGINYSFQNALNLSDPASVSYKRQLAYSAKHSGTLRAGFELGAFRAGYNLFFTGSRYRAGGELAGDRLPAFTTHDFNIAYAHTLKPLLLELKAEANNVFNRQYEIVKYYPMPGFNFRLTLTVTYKHNKQQS